MSNLIRYFRNFLTDKQKWAIITLAFRKRHAQTHYDFVLLVIVELFNLLLSQFILHISNSNILQSISRDFSD